MQKDKFAPFPETSV